MCGNEVHGWEVLVVGVAGLCRFVVVSYKELCCIRVLDSLSLLFVRCCGVDKVGIEHFHWSKDILACCVQSKMPGFAQCKQARPIIRKRTKKKDRKREGFVLTATSANTLDRQTDQKSLDPSVVRTLKAI